MTARQLSHKNKRPIGLWWNTIYSWVSDVFYVQPENPCPPQSFELWIHSQKDPTCWSFLLNCFHQCKTLPLYKIKHACFAGQTGNRILSCSEHQNAASLKCLSQYLEHYQATASSSAGQGNFHPLPQSKRNSPAMGLLHSAATRGLP